VNELERALQDLGARIDYPPTPELAPGVRTRLAARPTHRPIWRRRRLVLVLAVLLAALGAAMAVPQARTAILEFFGLRGATVERVVLLPEVPPDGSLALGEPVSLEEARDRVSFPVLVPELLGPPDEVYVADDVPRVSLVYRHDTKVPTTTGEGIGLLLTEFRGDLAPQLIEKMVAAGTNVEELTVDGAPGLWISGEPHVLLYRDERGDVREETLRLAGNTLLFERGNLLVRIESSLSKAEALEVAASLR
jgi:hypothetical protein